MLQGCAGATLDEMWEPLECPLTPERRWVVSTEDLTSPLGTAAPTFDSISVWRNGTEGYV